jgi:hypothetical protein
MKYGQKLLERERERERHAPFERYVQEACRIIENPTV